MSNIKRNILVNFFEFVERITYQGDFEYDFGYDVAQKITTLIVALIIYWSKYNPHDGVFFIFGTILGRVFIMTWLQKIINYFAKNRKSKKRFLNMPEGMWKTIAFVFVLYNCVKMVVCAENTTDFFVNIPIALIFMFISFFIFGGKTFVTALPPDPNKVGTYEWKRANGVEKVRHDLFNPLYRDKHGNYYEGNSYVPVPPPIRIDKKK